MKVQKVIRQTVLATGLTMVAGVAAAADTPTIAESNGFKSCVAAAERDARQYLSGYAAKVRSGDVDP